MLTGIAQDSNKNKENILSAELYLDGKLVEVANLPTDESGQGLICFGNID